MKRNLLLPIVLIILSSLIVLSCGSTTNVKSITPLTTVNTEEAMKKPYVILISLDGFRWDYVDTFKPPHLSAFIKKGTQATSLIPSFPTKTFPNHYTIATGMYPDNHGLLANTFYSYDKDATYRIRDRDKVTDGDYYKGTPIWIQANNHGMVTASYFFVGTEANIQDKHPTYYYNYDGKTTNQERVKQAAQWLGMPAKQRPHLITLYFSDLDDTGHKYGPNNEAKIKESLFKLDTALGDLFKKVDQTGLPVNIVIVSDHGMREIPTHKLIPTEKIKNDSLYTTIDNGVIMSIHPKDLKNTTAILAQLKSKEEHFQVYTTAQAPHFEYIPKNKDWGPIQVIPDTGYYFSNQNAIERKKKSNQHIAGYHGFSPEIKEMHGILYAQGPNIKNNFTHPSVKNIHIYPLLCELLDIPTPKDIDGNIEKIKTILKED